MMMINVMVVSMMMIMIMEYSAGRIASPCMMVIIKIKMPIVMMVMTVMTMMMTIDNYGCAMQWQKSRLHSLHNASSDRPPGS